MSLKVSIIYLFACLLSKNLIKIEYYITQDRPLRMGFVFNLFLSDSPDK